MRLSERMSHYQARVNPLDSKGNSATSNNNTKLVRWPLMGGCYISYSEEGPGRAASPPRPAVPNV